MVEGARIGGFDPQSLLRRHGADPKLHAFVDWIGMARRERNDTSCLLGEKFRSELNRVIIFAK